MRGPLAYLNGRRIPAEEACLPVWDAGVVQGAAVSELVRTFQKRPYRLDDHLARLGRSLACTGIDPGVAAPELAAAARELVSHNAQFLDRREDLGLVIFVTPGAYPTYAGTSPRDRPGPTVCLHTFPLPLARWAAAMAEGAHVVTPSIRHVPPECVPPSVKSRSRLHYVLADREARREDPHASAVLLDLAGNVTESNAANFLLVRRETLFSPPRASVLLGISLGVVCDLAGRLGIPFVERPIGLSDVASADEAILTSTPYCMLPVTRFNGAPVGEGRPGPVFHRLLEAWSRDVGVDIRRQILAAAGRAVDS